MSNTRREDMHITLNGKLESMEQTLTVEALLHRLKLDPKRVAVELNEDVVSRKLFSATRIHDGDQLEVVTFVGGG